MADCLFLCHSSRQPARVAKRLVATGQNLKWLFLGQDYLRLVDWKNQIGPLGEYVEIGETLNAVAEQLRGPFLDLMTGLNRDHNSIAWWASRLSERNTMVSPLFLYCCYLKIAAQQLPAIRGSLCVISESWEVLEALATVAEDRGVRTVWINRPLPLERTATFLARSVVRLLRFVLRSLKQICPDSAPDFGKLNAPTVLLLTWVDDDCFVKDGFRDRFLPGLDKWLRSQGYSVATIPILYNVTRSFRANWKLLRESDQQFLNPYAYFRFSDYLFAIRQAWRQFRFDNGPVELAGMDVTTLFDASIKQGFFDTGCIESILFYRLAKRLAESQRKIDLMIDEWENIVLDKVLILGFRQYLPATKLVGFQHATLYPLMLVNFVTAGESEFAPIPDLVVCNGEFFRDVLVGEGLPATITRLGPALRYSHLHQMVRAEVSGAQTEAKVLVTLPMVLDSAVELLVTAISAVESIPNVRVMLKTHPLSSPDLLLRAAQQDRLPENCEFVNGSMLDVLTEAHVVIALSSATVYEAFVAGVPVIVVGRETALDLNPLGWYTDLNAVVRTASKLRAKIVEMLSLSPEETEAYRRRAKQVLAQSFTPVNDTSMHAFIDGVIAPARVTSGGRGSKGENPERPFGYVGEF